MNFLTNLDTNHTDLLRNEISQAKVRLGICLFMAAYFYATGYTNHPLYISFIVYCFSFFIISHSAKRFSLFRTFFCLFLDNYFTIAGLYVTGEKGTFLFILLIQISIGYGLRFGRVYHWTSVLVACIGVIILYLYSPSWKGNLHLALAYVIGTPFIAFYIDFLVKNLKRSKLESDERANDIADLLAFVAHDIRTPLHSLLATAAAAKSDADDEQMRARITRIEDGIRSLARLATDVLSATSGDVHKPRDLRSTISVCQWVIEVSRRFRDELESKNIRLIYSFNMDVWAAISLDLLPAERLLLNTLSNAVRHAGNGEIEIELTLTCHNESKGDLVFTITNRLGKPTGMADSLSVSEPAASSKEYYGAGLGLLVANELASSLNGDFSFHQNDLNEYIARIRIPCYHASNDEISGVLLPVVLVTQSIDLVSRFRSILRDETNVIIFNRIQKLSTFVRDIDKNVAAIIIDEALVGDTLATSSAPSTLTLPKYYSLIESTAYVRTMALPHSPLNSIGSDPSDREILNTVRSQSAIRENETLGDLNLENINSGALKGKHVLILDDNRVNRALLQEGIRNAEGEITIAANIVDGVNILKTNIFDAILLDWNLGDQSGVRILEYLSSIPKEKQPAVFVLSSESSGKINLQVKPNSVAAVMERPVAISEVIKTIDQYLNGYSSQAHTFRSFRGSNLFDISMYDELISSGTQCEQILSLLTDFEYEIEKHIQLIKKATRERDLSNSAKQFHSIKSICFASGTYTMGEYFDYSAVRMFSNSNSASMIDLSRFIDLGIRIWDITRAHINIYKLSLTEM